MTNKDHAKIMAHMCRMAKQANLNDALIGAAIGGTALPAVDLIRGKKQHAMRDAFIGALSGGATGYGVGNLVRNGGPGAWYNRLNSPTPAIGNNNITQGQLEQWDQQARGPFNKGVRETFGNILPYAAGAGGYLRAASKFEGTGSRKWPGLKGAAMPFAVTAMAENLTKALSGRSIDEWGLRLLSK